VSGLEISNSSSRAKWCAGWTFRLPTELRAIRDVEGEDMFASNDALYAGRCFDAAETHRGVVE